MIGLLLVVAACAAALAWMFTHWPDGVTFEPRVRRAGSDGSGATPAPGSVRVRPPAATRTPADP